MAPPPKQQITPLDWRTRIVNDDGTPNNYFIRLWQTMFGNSNSDSKSIEELQTVVDALNDAEIQAGTGISISPDGHLKSNPTVALNASIGELNDVDLSTPPTNDQVLVYDDVSGTWKPAAQSGGGGGGNWTLIASQDFSATPQSRIEVDITGFSEVRITGNEIVHSSSVHRGFQLSTDGGTSWYDVVGNYLAMTPTGVSNGNWGSIPCHSTASDAARSFDGSLYLYGGYAYPFYQFQFTGGTGVRFGATLDIPNRLRFGGFPFVSSSGPPSAGNFTAGLLSIFGR